MFTGSKGDRLSATDFLLLFINDKVKDKHGVLDEIQKLRGKGVHVIVIGLGRSDIDVANYYEELASHPSDVSYLHSVELKHVVGDLASTSCRVVNCQDDPANGKCSCKVTDNNLAQKNIRVRRIKQWYD